MQDKNLNIHHLRVLKFDDCVSKMKSTVTDEPIIKLTVNEKLRCEFTNEKARNENFASDKPENKFYVNNKLRKEFTAKDVLTHNFITNEKSRNESIVTIVNERANKKPRNISEKFRNVFTVSEKFTNNFNVNDKFRHDRNLHNFMNRNHDIEPRLACNKHDHRKRKGRITFADNKTDSGSSKYYKRIAKHKNKSANNTSLKRKFNKNIRNKMIDHDELRQTLSYHNLRTNRFRETLISISRAILKQKQNKRNYKERKQDKGNDQIKVLFIRDMPRLKEIAKKNSSSRRIPSYDDIFGFRKSSRLVNPLICQQSRCFRIPRRKTCKKDGDKTKRASSCEHYKLPGTSNCHLKGKICESGSKRLHAIHLVDFPHESETKRVCWKDSMRKRSAVCLHLESLPPVCHRVPHVFHSKPPICHGEVAEPPIFHAEPLKCHVDKHMRYAEPATCNAEPPCHFSEPTCNLSKYIGSGDAAVCTSQPLCKSAGVCPEMFKQDLLSPCEDSNSPNSETNEKNILKYILLVLVVLVWSPCILIVACCWLTTYPLRPHWVRANVRSKCYSRYSHRMQRYKCDKCQKRNGSSFWTSFVKWVRGALWTNTRAFQAIASLVKCEDKVQVKCPNTPNPNKKYCLYHTSSRGWVMKPKRYHKQVKYKPQLPKNQCLECEGCMKMKTVQYPQLFACDACVISKYNEEKPCRDTPVSSSLQAQRSKVRSQICGEPPFRTSPFQKACRPCFGNSQTCQVSPPSPCQVTIQENPCSGRLQTRIPSCTSSLVVCRSGKRITLGQKIYRGWKTVKCNLIEVDRNAWPEANGCTEMFLKSLEQRPRSGFAKRFSSVYQCCRQGYDTCCRAALIVLSACVWCPPMICCYMCFEILCQCL